MKSPFINYNKASFYKTLGCFHQLAVCILYILILLQFQNITAQTTVKEPVTEKDYHLWGNLYTDQISENGNWASYRMAYDECPDTLFVRSALTLKTYKFPLSKTGNFNKETHFASIIPGKGLELLNLQNGSQKFLQDVNAFSFSENGRFLLTQRTSGKGKWLDIRNSNGSTLDSIAGIQGFVLNPTGSMALCSFTEGQESKLVLITLGEHIDKKVILDSKKGAFTYMVWQANSQSFAFLQHTSVDKNGNNNIYHYRIKGKKMFFLDPESAPDISKQDRISDTHQSKLTISDDGSKIFFGLEKKIPTDEYDPEKVQIWNGNDSQLYPHRKEYRNYEILSKITLWEPLTNRVLHIGTNAHPYVVLSGDQRFAITFDPSELGLQYKEEPYTNFYITSLATGITKLWLEDLKSDPFQFNVSPTGKFVAYFKGGNWWVYNFINETHFNLTDNKIKDLSQSEKVQTLPYGIEGWTANDRDIIVRDKYDLWKMSTDGKNYQKLTAGRDKNISYSVKKAGSELKGKKNFDGITGFILDPDNLLLKVNSSIGNGYYLLKGQQNLVPIVWGKGLITFLNKAQKNEKYIYLDEDFDRPPSLTIKNIKKDTDTVLFQSNPQHFNYLWGKSESVQYVNSKNQKINSVLYYPANYVIGKKYPMIVYIYEKWPDQLHQYYNPSLLLDIGFNPANLTAKGYFVLIPDIEHEIGNPGISATDCTTSAVKEIIGRGLVDANKIGLMAHSFGGYQANFIITQTNLFAAAVSGAGIGDFTGHYFSIGWNSGRAEIWRYEDQQNRMKKSFFEDKSGYDRNSPVQYADKVKTPILLWTGEEDRQIHYTQSIAFYLALKRNNKKQIMLIYPGDAHVISNKEHQIDLSRRTEQWFDHYLKGVPIDWISIGTK